MEGDVKISMPKLSKFIKPSLVMYHRTTKSNKYYKSGFKNCEVNDFINLIPG